MDIETVATRLGLSPAEQLTGGQFGAHRVLTTSGLPAVLKLLPTDSYWSETRVRHAVELAESLRLDGYPLPRFLDVGAVDGRVFTLQELAMGTTPKRLRPEHARTLIDLRRRHVDAADPDPGWGERLVAGLHDPNGELQTLIRYVGTGPALDLLDEAVAVGTNIEPGIFAAADVVHSDFAASNVLVRDDELVAVIDWEGARAGDSRADLTKLVWQTMPGKADPEVLRLFRDELAALPGEVVAGLAARYALSQLYFGLRSGIQGNVDWAVQVADAWLRPYWRDFID